MKFMKSLAIITLFVALIACNNSGNTNNSDQKADKETVAQTPIDAKDVAVYYFHSTRRCETCLAVEGVSSKAIKDFYKGAIPFSSLNVEEEAGEAKAKELEVSGSALIIMRGDEKIDITAEAFMYGREQGEKLRELIKAKIEPVKNL